ncbi:MAG: hypothetical protein ACRENF_02035, partial [Thermodesulfobacteriota bacterium]
MNKPVKRLMFFLAIFFVFGVVMTTLGMSKEGGSNGGGKDSNFQEFKAPLVKCNETTNLCGLDPESELLGNDPLSLTQGSRARITNYGNLLVRVVGAVAQKTYDVVLVYTPGSENVCSEPEPSPEPSPEPT